MHMRVNVTGTACWFDLLLLDLVSKLVLPLICMLPCKFCNLYFATQSNWRCSLTHTWFSTLVNLNLSIYWWIYSHFLVYFFTLFFFICIYIYFYYINLIKLYFSYQKKVNVEQIEESIFDWCAILSPCVCAATKLELMSTYFEFQFFLLLNLYFWGFNADLWVSVVLVVLLLAGIICNLFFLWIFNFCDFFLEKNVMQWSACPLFKEDDGKKWSRRILFCLIAKSICRHSMDMIFIISRIGIPDLFIIAIVILWQNGGDQ